MSGQDQKLALQLMRGVLLLTFLIMVPVGMISALFGGLFGLFGFAAAIALSAHLSGLHPLGESWGEVSDRVVRDLRPLLVAVSVAVAAALNVLMLVGVPFVGIMLSAFFALSIFLLGARARTFGELTDLVGIPILALVIASFITG